MALGGAHADELNKSKPSDLSQKASSYNVTQQDLLMVETATGLAIKQQPSHLQPSFSCDPTNAKHVHPAQHESEHLPQNLPGGPEATAEIHLHRSATEDQVSVQQAAEAPIFDSLGKANSDSALQQPRQHTQTGSASNNRSCSRLSDMVPYKGELDCLFADQPMTLQQVPACASSACAERPVVVLQRGRVLKMQPTAASQADAPKPSSQQTPAEPSGNTALKTPLAACSAQESQHAWNSSASCMQAAGHNKRRHRKSMKQRDPISMSAALLAAELQADRNRNTWYKIGKEPPDVAAEAKSQNITASVLLPRKQSSPACGPAIGAAPVLESKACLPPDATAEAGKHGSADASDSVEEQNIQQSPVGLRALGCHHSNSVGPAGLSVQEVNHWTMEAMAQGKAAAKLQAQAQAADEKQARLHADLRQWIGAQKRGGMAGPMASQFLEMHARQEDLVEAQAEHARLSKLASEAGAQAAAAMLLQR